MGIADLSEKSFRKISTNRHDCGESNPLPLGHALGFAIGLFHWAIGACLNVGSRDLSDSEVGGAGGGWGLSHKKEIHDKVTELWIRTLLVGSLTKLPSGKPSYRPLYTIRP